MAHMTYQLYSALFTKIYIGLFALFWTCYGKKVKAKNQEILG